MLIDSSIQIPDDSKSREELVRELSEMRVRLAAEEEKCRDCKRVRPKGENASAHKGIEGTLQLSEQLLRNILDNMVAMIGVLTPDGTLIQANRTALEAANLRPEDVLGKPFEECYWWAWSPEVQRRLRGAIEKADAGNVSRYDEVIRVGEGAFMTIDFMLAPMYGPDGRISCLIPSANDITNRKQAEDRIRDLARFPAENPNPVLRVNPGGELLFGNPASRPLLDSWGTPVGQVIPAKFVRTVRNVLARMRPEEVEVACGPRIYQFCFAPVEEGAYVNVYGQDISERKRAEEELRQSESFYRQMLESIPGMIFTTRPDGYCDYQSRQWVDYTGVPMSEHTGNGWNELLHPEDRSRAFAAWRAAVADKATYDLEYRVRRHDGKYEWFKVIGRPIRDAESRIVRWFGIAMNIEALKRAEEALLASREQLRRQVEEVETLMDVAPVAIWVSRDPKCDEIIGNRLANTFYEASEQENVSANLSPVRQFFSGDRELTSEELPMQAAAAGNTHIRNTDLDVLLPSGKRINIFGSASPLRDAKGDVRGCIGAFVDITARKQAETALLELNETLEQRVAERTELAEARAKQLQALAVELVEAEERERRRIAQLLHDDLQQLLAAGRMQLQAARVNLASDPLLANVERLLEESIGTSRRLSHELSPPVLHHASLVAALEWLSRQMGEQFGLNIELAAHVSPRLENAPLKVFLFRAVQELLFNVFKHAEVKNASVVISGKNGSLVITVSDRGRGFNPDILDFTTAASGLGLLSLRERTRHIGGTLVIESSPGQGSRFILTVPSGLAATG